MLILPLIRVPRISSFINAHRNKGIKAGSVRQILPLDIHWEGCKNGTFHLAKNMLYYITVRDSRTIHTS